MKKIIIIMLSIFTLCSCVFAGEVSEVNPLLDKLQFEMQRTLNKLDNDLRKLTRKISGNTLRSFYTRKLLFKFCQEHSLVIAAGTLDKYGKIITLEPGKYKKYQGKDSGYFEKRYPFQKPHRPFLTRAFRTVSSYFVVTLVHPVYDSDHNWIGSVGIVFQPDSFFTALIKPVISGFPVDAWVLETDGTQIYDLNPEEISRNIFKDQLYKSYPELIKLTERIVRKKTGSGRYRFLDSAFNKTVAKKAFWTTVGLHGTQWRIVLTSIELGDEDTVKREFPDLVSKEYLNDLRLLSRDPLFHNAIYTRRKRNVIKFFEKFYKDHPGIYGVQWIDPNAVNRYGFPEERSLRNYDFSDQRFTNDRYIVKAVERKKELVCEGYIHEGRKCKFYMTPIFSNDLYLGLIYYIHLVK